MLYSRMCRLDDLAEAMPAVAKGLQTLLAHDGDVQEVYSRNFEAWRMHITVICNDAHRFPMSLTTGK